MADNKQHPDPEFRPGRLTDQQISDDNDRLRAELDRLRLRLAESEQALVLCHQYMQSCFDGWRNAQLQRELAERRAEQTELFRRAREAAAEMGHTIRMRDADCRG